MTTFKKVAKFGFWFSKEVNITTGFLEPISSYIYHRKREIADSQTLTLNKICSDNENCDKRFNDLEKFLIKRGSDGKMIRRHVLTF